MTGAFSARRVFPTGGTGYVESRLIFLLCERGHRVRAQLQQLQWSSQSAARLGFVPSPQMLRASLCAVDHPPQSSRVLAVSTIQRLGS